MKSKKVIHSNSKDKIKIFESQAKLKLSEQSSKKENLAKEKIEQMVRDANLAVQQHITETAINTTLSVLEKKLNEQEKQNLINQSIKDLDSIFNN